MTIVSLGGVNSRHAKTVTHPGNCLGVIVAELTLSGFRIVSQTESRVQLAKGGSIATVVTR